MRSFVLSCALLAACAPRAESPRASEGEVLVYEGTIDREGHFERPFERRTSRVRWRVAPGAEATRLDWTEDGETETTWIGDRGAVRGGRALDPVDARALRDAVRATLRDAPDRRARVPHPRLGDVEESATHAAGSLEIVAYPRDESWRLSLRLVGRAPREEADRRVPEFVRWAPAPIRATRVADDLWTFDVDDEDARTVVVETKDGLVAVGAPLGSDVGERLVDAIAERLPGKPLRALVVGHYHPHYTGGARAFMAGGATVIAPPETARFVAWLAARDFTLAPDRFARAHAAPRIETFEGRRALAEGLLAIDVGRASSHTDEYVVVFDHAADWLIEDDAGWYAPAGEPPRASRRAAGVLAFLDREALRATSVLQLWPVRDHRATLPWDEWRALVNARR